MLLPSSFLYLAICKEKKTKKKAAQPKTAKWSPAMTTTLQTQLEKLDQMPSGRGESVTLLQKLAAKDPGNFKAMTPRQLISKLNTTKMKKWEKDQSPSCLFFAIAGSLYTLAIYWVPRVS